MKERIFINRTCHEKSVLWVLLALTPLLGCVQVYHYNTGNFSENVANLPITDGAGSAPRKVIFSQKLTELREGEIIQVLCEFQATEEHSYDVGLSSCAILGVSAKSTAGAEITEANGQDVTDAMHHHKRVIVGTHVVGTANVGTRYVNVVAWAYSTGARPGHTLTINRDHGRLSVFRFIRAVNVTAD